MKLRNLFFVAVGLVTMAVAGGTGLKLTPGTVSTGAVAKWIKYGSNTNHALYLAKNVPTTDYEAAGADIGGVRGHVGADLTLLSWVLLDGTREGGSPRWDIYLDSNGNGQYDIADKVIFLDHNTAGGDDDSFDAAEIQAQIAAQGGNSGDAILYLQVIVDVQHAVVLDDVQVGLNGETTTFSGPGKSD